MPLTGEAKRTYQRAYKQRKREAGKAEVSQATQVSTTRETRRGDPQPHPVLSEAQIAKALGGLTPRQAIAAAELMRGASRSKAARAAGFNQSTLHPSRASGRKILTAAVLALTRAGATLAQAAKVTAESLAATETKFFPTLAHTDRATGEPVIPSRDVVAFGHRLDAAKEVFKIHDAYPKDGKDEADRAAGPIWEAIEAQARGITLASPLALGVDPLLADIATAPAVRLARLLDTWSTMDESAWTDASVQALYGDIMDVFKAHPREANGWYRTWRKKYSAARLL